MPAKKTPSSQPGLSSDQNMNDAKKAVLDKALNDIVKRYGEGSIMRLGEAHQMQVEAIPTGALSLDLALGVGASQSPHHRNFGPILRKDDPLPASWRSANSRGGFGDAPIDMEHALDPVYSVLIRGVNIDQLLISQARYRRTGAGNCAETLVRSGAVELVVVDSVCALVPRSEIEGDMGDLPWEYRRG